MTITTTDNLVPAPDAVPFYNEEDYAYSAYLVGSPPSDISSWTKATPSVVSGKPYLWKRTRLMTWSVSANDYVAGSYVYTCLTGNAIVYDLKPSATEMKFVADAVGTFSPTEFVLSVSYTETDGETTTEYDFPTSASGAIKTGMIIIARAIDSTGTPIATYSGSQTEGWDWIHGATSGYTWANNSCKKDGGGVIRVKGTADLSAIEFAISSAQPSAATESDILKRITIPLVKDIHRAIFPMGEWTAQAYARNNVQIPMVHYGTEWSDTLECYGHYYYLNTDSAASTDVPGTSTKWTQCDEYGVIIAQAIFASFAQFGSGVMNGDYQFSKYGYMLGFGGKKMDSTSTTLYRTTDVDDMFGEGDMYDTSAMIKYATGLSTSITSTSYTTIFSQTISDTGYYTIEIGGYSSSTALLWQVVNSANPSVIYASGSLSGGSSSEILISNSSFKLDSMVNISLKLAIETSGGSATLNRYYMRKCKFIPKFILNLLTGETAQENITVRGNIQQGVTLITPTNYRRYTFTMNTYGKTYIDPTKIGRVVHFTKEWEETPPEIGLPTFKSETDEMKDKLRGMADQSITIINDTEYNVKISSASYSTATYATIRPEGKTVPKKKVAILKFVHGFDETWSTYAGTSDTEAKVVYGEENGRWRISVQGEEENNITGPSHPWWAVKSYEIGELVGTYPGTN